MSSQRGNHLPYFFALLLNFAIALTGRNALKASLELLGTKQHRPLGSTSSFSCTAVMPAGADASKATPALLPDADPVLAAFAGLLLAGCMHKVKGRVQQLP